MDATVAVVGVESVGSDTIAIEFESPEGFDARPGQFVKLTGTADGEEFSRFYTISSPDAEGSFELTVGVDLDEAGAFSRHLMDLEPGDELDVAGPFGRSYYESESRVVILAGGPGVGPAVGIGEAAIADGNEVAIVYQYEGTPAHETRLEELRDASALVTLIDESEALADHADEIITGGDGEQVFVYGFSEFVGEAELALTDADVDPGDAKIENFG